MEVSNQTIGENRVAVLDYDVWITPYLTKDFPDRAEFIRCIREWYRIHCIKVEECENHLKITLPKWGNQS